MSDTIGRITVPSPASSASVFPLVSDFGYSFSQGKSVIPHQFQSGDAKIEQRFLVGIGPNRYGFRQRVTQLRRKDLLSFWELRLGPWESFLYNAPQADQSTVQVRVNFENQPLSFEHLVKGANVGLTFVEVPDPAGAPTYTVGSSTLRFPSTALKTALLDQVQEIIPLVRIRVLEAAVPDIYLSDRRVTVRDVPDPTGVGSHTHTYLPRLLNIGEQNSGVLITQTLNGMGQQASDDCSFSFGNGDRAMTLLANDTKLRHARIELSLFHVGSGILLQNLWVGFIVTWSNVAGSEFTVQASDGLYLATLDYPNKINSRTCWKNVGDQITCFAALVDGVPPPCDRSFARCTELGQTERFGGIIATPQGVSIKDNSTGTIGIGRNTVTATSIVADTTQGAPLPDIWCSDDGDPLKYFQVPCLIAAGRDESDFFDALGVVGSGPLGAYGVPQMVDQDGDGKKELLVAHLLDGQPHHGFKVDANGSFTSENSNFGLRTVLGNDPNTASFSLGQGSPQVWTGPERSAGTAWIEIRRTDQPGIQASKPEDHQMTAIVSGGLTAYQWTAPGARAANGGCTDPYWIAVNTLLRGLGLLTIGAPDIGPGDIAAQEAAFDIDAAMACSSIANTAAPKLVGSGTEAQWRFKGLVGQQRKPLKDWLGEILAGACGYYTWSAGRFRVGIRQNASAVESFTAGNMLLGSLQLGPMEPAFEKLTASFADEDYLYAANTVDFTDFAAADENGRILSPLASEVHLLGCFSKSQAYRFLVTRVREEVGGVTATERKNARMASWSSTILAVNSEPGQVVSIADADIPGGTGKFRVTQMRIMRDWSVQFNGRTVTNSMYDMEVGDKPADVIPAPVPGAPLEDSDKPPSPIYNLQLDPLDPTAVLISGIQFVDLINTKTVSNATFEIYYSDDAVDPRSTLSTDMDSSIDYMDPDDLPLGTSEGDYIQFLDTGEVVAILGFDRDIDIISRISNVVTVRVGGDSHHLPGGAVVTISGVKDSSFNAVGVTVTVTGLRTFTYAQTDDDATSDGGTVTAASMAITRGALGTDFDATALDHAHAPGAEMIHLQMFAISESFAYRFFWDNDSDMQQLSVPLPGMRVVASRGLVTNLFGNSDYGYYGLLILLSDKGLILANLAEGDDGDTIDAVPVVY